MKCGNDAQLADHRAPFRMAKWWKASRHHVLSRIKAVRWLLWVQKWQMPRTSLMPAFSLWFQAIAATELSLACLKHDMLVPLGKYWRSNLLVFSLLPRCHALLGRRLPWQSAERGDCGSKNRHQSLWPWWTCRARLFQIHGPMSVTGTAPSIAGVPVLWGLWWRFACPYFYLSPISQIANVVRPASQCSCCWTLPWDHLPPLGHTVCVCPAGNDTSEWRDLLPQVGAH